MNHDVERIYELSPMQEAMLVASLVAPDSGVYVVQVALRLSSGLDLAAFERAWRFVLARHSILRTGFYWEGQEKPVQVVYREVDLPLRRESWRNLEPQLRGAAGQEERLQAFLDADREHGFDLGEPPLLRLTLIELEEGDWQLVWSMHHILTDGVSRSLLLRELFESYAAFAAGREPAFPDPSQFEDYIVWLQRWDASAAESFWRRSLEGFSSPTLLAGANGHHGPASVSFRATHRRSGYLPAEVTAALRELARRHHLTLATVIYGAWALVVAQETGSEEVVFGGTVSGRPLELPGIESMVGLFINTLPVRVAVDPVEGLLPWLASLQEWQSEARRYESAPLAEMHRWSGLAAGAPLFDNILVIENHLVDGDLAGRLPDLAVSEVRTNELTGYPIHVVVVPGSELQLDLLYDTRRVSDAAAARLAERLTGALRAFAAAPQARLGEVSLLLPGERQQVVVEHNDAAAGFPADLCVHELVAAQAARTPQAVAVRGAGRELRYGELAELSRRVAQRLARLGVGPEVLVGVCVERTPSLPVALLGVLEAGGGYVPLDPTHPRERLGWILSDSRARVVLTERSLLGLLPPHDAQVVLLDEEEGERGTEREAPRPVSENLAYVIYTSGSTGRPKGVEVRHRGVVNYLASMAARPGLGAGDAMLAVTTLSFDIAVTELFLPLSVGARVELVDRETAGDAALLAAALESSGATCMQATPATWSLLVEGGWPGKAGLKALCGGEALPRALAEKLLPRVAELWNLYGPTETTVWSALLRVSPGEGAVPVGRPLANTSLHLLSRQGDVAPLEVMGELAIGGEGLARGYHRRPELTAERFVPDPFGGPGSRIYRTGDLARRLPDGTLEFLGRSDHQVKVRGFRIELGEIEAVLASHPAVRECVVVARQDGDRGKVLVGYVVFQAKPAEAGALRDFLAAKLPPYMVPAVFVPLAGLPLSPAGKVDRNALPAPAETGEAGPGEERFAPPSADPTAELVAGVWAEVLGRERVGIDDDFFALGGHSLLATRVVSRLRSVLRVELPLRSVLEKRTVGALTAAVRAELQGERRQAPIRPAPRQEDLPLSFAQERFWFIDQLEPGSPRYNIAAAVRLAGPLAVLRLEGAFAEVARRHEILRTTFRSRDGEPVQIIAPEPRLALPLVDLSRLGRERQEGEARRLAAAESLLPFDLREGPLVRLTLLRLGEEEHLLLATLHHIVADAWSMVLLVREVQALYRAWSRGEPSPLPELPIQYADFAAWQRQWLDGEALARQLGYWREQLGGSTGVLELPADRPRPAMLSQRGGEHRFAIDRELARRIQALGRREGATPFMIAAAALCTLLSRISGEPDLRLATPIAARQRLELESLIGCFVNTLVLRVDERRAETFLELLEQVREVSLGAYAHQDLPFERLVDELQPERDLSRPPLAQVALSFHNIGLPEADLDGLRMVSQDAPSQVAKFDLAFILAENREGGFSGWLQYSSDLYDPATAIRLSGHLTRCLDELTAWPEQPLADLSCLTEGERQQAVHEWNDTAEAPVPEVLLHQLFEAQAEARPAATAVVWEGIEQSYAGLEARANRVAGLLRRLTGPGAAVGVWMERSHHTLAALLGILKAGGTYVPLDPAWPAERVEAILGATGATVAVVSRATLPAAEALRWRLPRLADLLCLDVEEPEVAAETVDEAGVRALWDLVAARATDRVTAGGFVSSFTGEALSEAEVDEYRDRVLSLAGPWLRPDARVLEVGCGSGLILWEMARRAGRCVGFDPSPLTQQRNREHARVTGIGNVELEEGFAHEIGGRFAPGSFDLVVMASTVQFFPGPHYLEKVVAQALELLAPGGALLLADVPDACREAELREALAAAGAPARRGERELWIDEGLFRDLAAPGAVEILHRREGFSNELRYRYDVLLHAEARTTGRRSHRLWTGWHVEQHAATRPFGSRSPEEIAYVIHTSGSTGAPKGIAVQHAPVAGLIRWVNQTFAVGPDDRLLFITPLTFDLSVYDIFGILAAGGTVQVAPETALGNAEHLVRLLRETPVTIWDSAPAALQQLVPLLPPAAVGAGRPLRLVLLSGDWIPVRLPDQVRAAFPGARVVALGGATEATVWSNWYPVAEVDPRWPSIPYGRPITGARYHVLDAGMQPCPIGVPGDLYIGGSCLCTGYSGQPELTAWHFVPDPFAPSEERGARLYRTGDRTRAWRDGTLEFLGRADQRVKVRGYRIEPGEIEVALLRHPALREAVVTVREDRPGDQMLVAYVVPRAEPPSAEELREWLRGKLPSYMVPAAYVALDALPVTANGKLDRGRLPDPRQEHGEEGYTAPSDPVEELLAGLFADLLDLERVGTGDSFFALGGHSLLATQLISRIRERLGVELVLAHLFEGPTVADLAREVRSARQAGVSAAPPILPVPRPPSGELALSFAQQRLWFVDQLEPGNPAYNVPWAAQLLGTLDTGLLRRILAEVVRRHEVLRTTFSRSSRGPVSRVQESRPVPLPVISLEGLPESASDAEVRRLVAAEALRSFDLARGPLLHVTLLRLDARRHVLITVMHHIVSDGWSMGVLLREVGALYRAFASNAPSPLPELSIQYADFALWQREWLKGEVLEGQLAYWRDALAGAPQSLELPLDRPRPSWPAHRAGVLSRLLAPDLSRGLAAFSRREGATLFMTLLGAFGALLGRVANQEDVLVGSPVASRNRREIEELIGFFVNTLVMRVPLQGRPLLSFRELLGRVRQSALGAYMHQDLPFERLVEELVTERADVKGGPPPLFQVMLGLQNAPTAPLELPGLEVSPLAPEGGAAKYDLTLLFAETPAGLTGWLEYDAALFDRTTAERLLARLEGFLASALAEPDRGVGEMGMLLVGERAQLVWEWNDSAGAYPRETGVGELFAEWARAQPQAPAVVTPGETWSYGRLDEEANRLAGYLRSLGVEREVRVGVAMERSAELILSLLAVIKAGGTYVPLDAGYPDERLRFMLADSGVAVVLVHGPTRQRLTDLAAGPETSGEPPWPLVCVECDRQAIAAFPAVAPPGGAALGGQLVYVTYTSGSTGRPKGVAVPHRAVARLVRGTNYVQLGPDDRVAHASNVSFDAATFEIWGALANGGAVVVIERDAVLSPGRLAERLREERVTAMFLTTALFNQVVRDEPTAFYPVGHLMFGGEASDPALVGRALSEGPPERLLHVYGPTESTTFALWREIREVEAGALSIPLGRPLSNTTAYVVDMGGALAVPGQAGELWLGGDGLARGYFNRPDLTAEKLVPDPWGGEPGGRLYRTGDLVRQRPDGEVDFLGRIDAQVKIRGFRIEPGEVEAVLTSCPGVRECAVLARRDSAGQAGELRLVAYVVAAPGSGLREAAVRDFLKQSLPDYMVPAAFLFLESLPLTPNGKIDRAALPAPEGAAAREDGYVAPRNPVEGLLAGIWEEVLGRERVGVTDDFFALGGHSLLATQVVSRIRETFGVEMPVHDLFERPTVAQLAADLDLLLHGRALLGEVPPILPVPRSPGDELPLSFAQQRLWFIDQLEPGTLIYNMPWGARLTGTLDAGRLRRTLEEVVRRHEALRTTFSSSSNGPVSRVLESQPVPLPVVSLEGLPESAAAAEVQRLGLAELQKPFDLSRGPLLRTTLLRLDEREHVLIAVMHHIVSDGWSMGVLQREIGQLYGAFSRGAGSPLPELPIQYADFAVWQREWLQGEVLATQLAHWRDALAGAPLLLELPTDRPRLASPSHRGGALPARLPAALARELEAFSRREGVTPFMTLLAAFGVLLGRLADQEDVLVGSPIANRNRREIEDLIGFFVNTLVLRVMQRGTPRPSFRELLGRVREAALGAYTHQDLPFERLVEELVTERRGGYPPLVQVVFALQNAPVEALELPNLTLSPMIIENGLARFDFILMLTDSPSGFHGALEYSSELFDRTTAERLLARLEGLLGSALAEPERGVEELELLLAGERAQLLWEWNDNASAYPREAGVTELFAQVARELPDEPAILAQGEVWTYRRLDEESSRLALRLRALGVGLETPVGLAMERSSELILGLLAIVKAGGVYVPLDVRYPDKRLAFMLEDTGARVVLVQEATRERMAALSPPPHLETVEWGLPSAGEESWEAGRGTGGDALVYIIYTSGSTGRPKGVAVSHRGVVRLLRETNYVHLGPGARLGQVASISFDVGTYEIWGALITGAAVVVIPRETVLDPQAFATALREQRVTSMFLTSALFTKMAQEMPDAFEHMSELLVGGEAVDPAAARKVLAHRPPRRLLNGYGPTENTVFSTWHHIREVPDRSTNVPIGQPLANSTVYVLDPWQNLVPLGSAGELCAGGDGLARGYWNRPELTAERFVPHPWGQGERLYRTGDLARQRPDGAVEYLGRLDHQVKIRGFRIEPGEIEAVLAGHPAVRECAVLARQSGAAGGLHLVAYAAVEPQAAGEDPESSLRAWLQERLPDYLVPSAWVFLEVLPLTDNGKVDRRALPAPQGRQAGDRGYIAPSGPVEEGLAEVWAEVLRLDRVGAHDDFFALGGHSLLATQVVTRVREKLGMEMPLRRLFDTSSLRQLARSLGEPPSFPQQRLWLRDERDPGEPGDPADHLPLAFRLTGELSVEALERTFAEMVCRHAVLRTTFAEQAGRLVQVIAPPEDVPLELRVLDLSETPDEAREEWARELALEEARSPFDLGHGPLLRIGLLRLTEREHLLLITLHRIISDGWSADALLREIETLYPAFLDGEPSPLPELRAAGEPAGAIHRAALIQIDTCAPGSASGEQV